ncbi:MAG: histidine phosphatase family protein [Oscillospiraceae bacterium]|nr:histidine phosphatase family protein [Oscillospiraceae bacterium]
MKILLIRHGMTEGNQEKKYIGRTDEPLCSEGVRALKQQSFSPCEILVSSPKKRCVETAQILFPEQNIHIMEAFQECDFGDFEGKNYKELNGNPQYQAWIDSGGTRPFPNGESSDDFRQRCCAGFLEMIKTYSAAESIAMTVHGGTIMAILSRFAEPHKDYYDWMTENGHGWLCECKDQIITVLEKR